MISFNIG
jgi:pantothenate kinase